MGLIESIRGQLVYLDANLLTYLVESDKFPRHQPIIEALFFIIDNGFSEAITSELTLGEILTGPMRDGRDEVVDIYRKLITEENNLRTSPVTLEIIDSAALLRAHSSLKMPDALHLATALSNNCDAFLTNDKRLRAPSGLPLQIIQLSELHLSQ